MKADLHQERADREGVSRAAAKLRNWLEGVTGPRPIGLALRLAAAETIAAADARPLDRRRHARAVESLDEALRAARRAGDTRPRSVIISEARS